MRTIQVSTDVFARLWAERRAEEQSEDQILRRLLGCQSDGVAGQETAPTPFGFQDYRHGVSFPDGFAIFRTYHGQNFRAHAAGGFFVLEPEGKKFSSLNELSRAIGIKTENAWINWFYADESGRRRPVGELRDPSSVASRPRGRYWPEEFASEEELDPRSDITWREDVREALLSLGGRASLHAIYRKVAALRRAAGRSVPASLEATVRRILEDHSSDALNSRGPDLFRMAEGKGAGIWALR